MKVKQYQSINKHFILRFNVLPGRRSGEDGLELENQLGITSEEGKTAYPRTKQFPPLGGKQPRHGNSGPMGKRILRSVLKMIDERWTAWVIESTLDEPIERLRVFEPGRIP